MGQFYNTLRMKGYILRTSALWGRGLILALVSVSLIALFTEYAHTQVRFAKTYGGTSDDMARFVQQTPDGGYIVVGYIDSFGAGDYDIFLIKTDANGNIQWAKTYGGTNDDGAYSVQQTSDGGYIVAGYTYSFGAGSADLFLIKTNANGNIQWAKTYGGTIRMELLPFNKRPTVDISWRVGHIPSVRMVLVFSSSKRMQEEM